MKITALEPYHIRKKVTKLVNLQEDLYDRKCNTKCAYTSQKLGALIYSISLHIEWLFSQYRLNAELIKTDFFNQRQYRLNQSIKRQFGNLNALSKVVYP